MLDETDLRILAVLQTSGRITNRELAEMAGLSEAACLRRVQRLEDQEVLLRIVALVEPEAVRRSLTVFVDVVLLPPIGERIGDFEAAVLKIPDVLECHRLLGEVDYQLKVVAADLRAYDDLYRRSIISLPGVSRTVSRVSQSQVKYETALPLPTATELRRR